MERTLWVPGLALGAGASLLARLVMLALAVCCPQPRRRRARPSGDAAVEAR